MLRKNVSPTLMLASLTVVFLLCSPSVFSDDVRRIEFLQKAGEDTDTYTVTAEPDLVGNCIGSSGPSWPAFVQTTPGDEGQVMYIRCGSVWDALNSLRVASQLFKVVSNEHPERVALFWWIKLPMRDPILEREYDPAQLLWVDVNDDGYNIKVWISYGREPW